MTDFPIGLREVVPDQTVPEKCKEFVINTGNALQRYVVFKPVLYFPGRFIHIPRVIEIFLFSGGAQSTLQDIKVPDCAGGFVYGDNGAVITRNRFISWRTSHDVST